MAEIEEVVTDAVSAAFDIDISGSIQRGVENSMPFFDSILLAITAGVSEAMPSKEEILQAITEGVRRSGR